YNDIESVKQLIDQNTAAIMLETIQGEGGVIPAKQDFIDELVELAEKYGVLIIIDEIQTGIGRTGKGFGFEHYGLEPDIFTVAKGLGNGIPVGAMIAKQKYKEDFGPGSHGSTFGGNPIAMAAAEAVVETVINEQFLKEVEAKGKYLVTQLEKELQDISIIKEIRGKGLMVGIECSEEVAPFIKKLLNKGVLVLSAGTHVLRLLPPLIFTYEEINKIEKIIKVTKIIKEISGKGLMVGIECSEEVAPFIKKLLNKGVLVLSAGTHVLRLLPPLIVTYEEIDKIVKMIKHALSGDEEK